jgi:hypothetical protein
MHQKYAVKGGVCVTHGAMRACTIVGCNRGLFKEKKCRFHYRCSLGDFGPHCWDPSIITVMGMVGCELLACLGMTKQNGEISVVCQWDDVFAISGVC